MDGWREYVLEEILEITSSKRIFYEDYTTFGVPFYRSKEIIEKASGKLISTNIYISKERFRDIRNQFGTPACGDILLTSVGSIGIPYIVVDEEFYFKDGNLTWFKNFSNKIQNNYLKYWIISPLGKGSLDEIVIGSTQQALTIAGLKALKIVLPTLAEQQAIAAVLSSLDDKIDLLHRQNKTLEALAQTLFRQWFVEEADEEWEENISGFIEFNPRRELKKGTLAPYIEMSALSATSFSPSSWYMREFASGAKFTNGDTLLARITPCLENGKAAFIQCLQDSETGWGSTEYIVLRPKKFLHPLFAYALVKTVDFRDHAESCLAGSSGRQRVELQHLMQYSLKMPSQPKIHQFNDCMVSLLPRLTKNACQIRTLTKLRDTLLPKLMSGEVRVDV